MKNMFPKGTICRKQTNSGTPIGPWLYIRSASSRYVYASVLENGYPQEDQGILLRKNVYKPTLGHLPLSIERFKDMKNGEIVIEHDSTKHWESVLTEEPTIVVFFSMDGNIKAWCTIDSMKRFYSCATRTYRIRIVIDRVVLWQEKLNLL